MPTLHASMDNVLYMEEMATPVNAMRIILE